MPRWKKVRLKELLIQPVQNGYSPICQEIDLLKKQAEALRKQKRGLMQKLLTGQWRVKVQ
jgi:restriction endonuclease S subunit